MVSASNVVFSSPLLGNVVIQAVRHSIQSCLYAHSLDKVAVHLLLRQEFPSFIFLDYQHWQQIELQSRTLYYHLDSGSNSCSCGSGCVWSSMQILDQPVSGAPKPLPLTTETRNVEKLKGQILAQFVPFLEREMGVHLHFMFPFSGENSWVTARNLLPTQVINKSLFP